MLSLSLSPVPPSVFEIRGKTVSLLIYEVAPRASVRTQIRRGDHLEQSLPVGFARLTNCEAHIVWSLSQAACQIVSFAPLRRVSSLSTLSRLDVHSLVCILFTKYKSTILCLVYPGLSW